MTYGREDAVAVDGAVKIPLQAASYDIWERKYRLKTSQGEGVDQTIDAMHERVAAALAAVEATSALQMRWKQAFLWALQHGAIPAGRILSNAGAQQYKPATSTINCTVSGTIEDSMDGILCRLHEAGLTLKSGAGIGYEFSTLRPRGAYVSGAGAYSSGPVSFMEIYDRTCFTISSAGGRRGAQMATFDISHPDVLEFIQAKRESGRLRQFNLSLLISSEFMEAVKSGADWPLVFPLTYQECNDSHVDLQDLQDLGQIVWRAWPSLRDHYIKNETGQIACRVYKTIQARQLWDAIMRSTYTHAEPGFILIDQYNDMNNNWFCETIRATNPCGEQGLPPYGACLLGSIDLTRFVRFPFQLNACFDWEKFREVVAVFTRMLDNVVEINGLPLAQQRAEIFRKRRHGLGFLGLGSAMALLRMRYGSADSLVFAERVSREMAIVGWQTALALSKEKGPAPVMQEDFAVTLEMLRNRPEMQRDGWKVGEQVKGRILHARYSRYMQRIGECEPELIAQLAEVGARFTHHSSIAPTGTIALSLGNNASNGIEPSFSHHYSRNIIREKKKTKEKIDVCSYEWLAYRTLVDGQAKAESDLPAYFVTAADVTPQQHIEVQAAVQKWIDSSISKTINVPADYPYEDFKDIYLRAYASDLKGCTTFRFNPEVFQGVLVTEKNLEETLYKFTLASGRQVVVKGNEIIEYDGEMHTAANLYDALKEGYYGRF